MGSYFFLTLDTTSPVVTITEGPDVSVVSKVAGRDTCAFSFSVNEEFYEYKVKAVPSEESAHDDGVQIPETSGSVNMTGANETGFPAGIAIHCIIKGADLAEATGADGEHIIKVFVKDQADNWSEGAV